MVFKVIIRPNLEDGGYNVSCPAIPGCHSQGETIEEALKNWVCPIVETSGCLSCNTVYLDLTTSS